MVPRRYSVVGPSGGALQPAAAVVVGKAPGPPGLPQPASRARATVSVASAAARITAPV